MLSGAADRAANTDNDSSHLTAFRLLLPQALVGLVDAISFMIVAPSLIFYVLQVGGTKEQYGLILSAFSLASFLFKPVLGYWSDKAGLKFRMPYLTSIAISAVGAFLYFLAGTYDGPKAITMLLLGRFLSGFGAANNTLGFSYIATVIPPDFMTQANALLSMVRVLGMVSAPGLNVALHLIDFEVTFGGVSFSVDELNSVGLLVLFGNIISFLAIFFLLEEPTDEQKPKKKSDDAIDERGGSFWRNIFKLDILLPILLIFVINCNFQLVETGMAPSASDALGWGPVAISSLFAMNAILMFLVILLTFRLASKGVTDMSMIFIGLTISIMGYTMIYLFWKRGISKGGFIFPCESRLKVESYHSGNDLTYIFLTHICFCSGSYSGGRRFSIFGRADTKCIHSRGGQRRSPTRQSGDDASDNEHDG